MLVLEISHVTVFACNPAGNAVGKKCSILHNWKLYLVQECSGFYKSVIVCKKYETLCIFRCKHNHYELVLVKNLKIASRPLRFFSSFNKFKSTPNGKFGIVEKADSNTWSCKCLTFLRKMVFGPQGSHDIDSSNQRGQPLLQIRMYISMLVKLWASGLEVQG